MKHYILRNVLSSFDEATTQSIASKLAERHANVINALERIIPTILRGFASKSQEAPANALLQLAAEANNNSWWQKALNWITDEDKMQKGHEMLQQLFGNSNIDRIGDQIAQKTMIRSSSAVKLMQWAAPLCLGTVGKEIKEKNYDAITLAAWLSKEPFDIDGDGFAGGAQTLADTETAWLPPGESKKPERKALSFLPLLLLVLFLGLMWWAFKDRNSVERSTVPVLVQEANAENGNVEVKYASMPEFSLQDDSTVTFKYDENIVWKLPGMEQITVARNSAEALLINRIEQAIKYGLDTTEGAKQPGWVNLYDVQFVKGTTYREGATRQLKNIATILKAYPGVKIKIGGYTDNTGTDELNAEISQQRADKVMQELRSLNATEQIVKGEGYGSQYPVADNSTREGRALNRRVSCRIVSVTR